MIDGAPEESYEMTSTRIGTTRGSFDMTTLIDSSSKDSDGDIQTSVEEEIKLPQYSSVGKLTYFFWWWIMSPALFCTIVSPFIFIFIPILLARVFANRIQISSVALCVIHWILFFIAALLGAFLCCDKTTISKKALGRLLEEVADADLIEDPAAWRRCAFRVNQLGYHYSYFHSGRQCKNFFVRTIVKPVVSKSYTIKYRNREWCGGNSQFCDDQANKIRAQRAVENYKRSFATSHEFSKACKEEEKYHGIGVPWYILLLTLLIYIWPAVEIFVIIYAAHEKNTEKALPN